MNHPPKYPFLRPNPPKLSQLGASLSVIEESGVFSNYGPTNRELERSLVDSLFGGTGSCVTTCNATLGLMLAIRLVLDRHFEAGVRTTRRKYAVMPAFTFAATAHAAIWNNLTPLFCDIERDTWHASLTSLERLFEEFSEQIAVIVPYATFGNNLDLSAYWAIASRHQVPIVVDAAASLGSVEDDGHQFGRGFKYPVIYSMHVTKTFATGEAGLVYCADDETIAVLRCMGNFGFGKPRSATLPGLNSKLTEIGALLAIEKLKNFSAVVEQRQELADAYRRELPELSFQVMNGPRHAYQFMPALLPGGHRRPREYVVAKLAAAGVSAATYFSPHLAEQPYFMQNSKFLDLKITQEVSARVISLPIYDSMTHRDVQIISKQLRNVLAS